MSSLQPNGGSSSWRNPYRGMLRIWLFDLGSVSFLGTGALGLVVGLLCLISGDIEGARILFSMTIVSTAAAIAWQLNRLAATESTGLVPSYQAHVLQQAATIAVGVLLLLILACIGFFAVEVIPRLLIAIVVSLLFIWACLWRSNSFHLSFVLFITVPFLDKLAPTMPPWVMLIIAVVLSYRVIGLCRQLRWNNEARVVYLNAVQMGWMWLPSIKGFTWVTRVERFFHPMNFFIGPMLVLMVLCLPIITLGLMLLSWFFELNLPTLFLLAQFSVITCAIVHWSRIQRWRATETLFLLPCYSGLTGMKVAFYRSQYRFIAVLVIMVSVIGLVSLAIDPQLTLLFVFHLGLSTFWGCAIMLGAGSASRNSHQATAAMLIVFVHSILVSLSFAALKNGDSMMMWLLVDAPLVVIGIATLTWGKRQLWKNGITVA
ncbi:ABC transporter permease [Shewanella livingstonensis]|uniref:ABC transporter permease n=1 Tax=Shewanella livingstonensis TaxID=150120 RepID=A0A3G8LRA8_9GAMM|nr:ABC transporter permease [Shewanella livingstonensis]AZG71400.1 ABC transporter permease [Shewanella livingstonensis]